MISHKLINSVIFQMIIWIISVSPSALHIAVAVSADSNFYQKFISSTLPPTS